MSEYLTTLSIGSRVLVRVTEDECELPDDLTMEEARRVIQHLASWALSSFNDAGGFYEDMVKMEEKLRQHGISLD